MRSRRVALLGCGLAVLVGGWLAVQWRLQAVEDAGLNPEAARLALVALVKSNGFANYPVFGSEEARERLAHLRSELAFGAIDTSRLDRGLVYIGGWTCSLKDRTFLVPLTCSLCSTTLHGTFAPNLAGSWDAEVSSYSISCQALQPREPPAPTFLAIDSQPDQ